jgi:hypothetical protein
MTRSRRAWCARAVVVCAGVVMCVLVAGCADEPSTTWAEWVQYDAGAPDAAAKPTPEAGAADAAQQDASPNEAGAEDASNANDAR